MQRYGSFHIVPLLLLISFGSSCTSLTRIQPTLYPTIALPTKPAKTLTQPTAPPTQSPTFTSTVTATPEPTPAPLLLAGAGDIAYCGEENLGDEQTAAIIAEFPHANVFTTGDNVYGEGTRAEFRNCYDPSWGQFKDRTRPSPGNHDYMTESGIPYFTYFGTAAGEAGNGYYSYDLREWHIVALNSNCNDIACGTDSRQAAWLREDLASSNKRCTLLYWHHPRWSSGVAGGSSSVWTFWRTAAEMGVEIVVNGHDHNYERFAPQDAEGNADINGVREFVVGTGGAMLRDFGEIKTSSEVRYNKTHGIILFRLFTDRYEWEFIPTSGNFRDNGSGVCH